MSEVELVFLGVNARSIMSRITTRLPKCMGDDCEEGREGRSKKWVFKLAKN